MSIETKTPDVYPEGGKGDEKVSEDALASEIRALGKACVLLSPLTNLPYVECEEVNYNDQVRLYAEKSAADSAAEELEAKGSEQQFGNLRPSK